MDEVKQKRYNRPLYGPRYTGIQQKANRVVEAGQGSQIQLDLFSGLVTEICSSFIMDWELRGGRWWDLEILQSKCEMTAPFNLFQFLQICSHPTVEEAGEPHGFNSPKSFLVQELHLPLLWGCTPGKKVKGIREDNVKISEDTEQCVCFFLKLTLSQLNLIDNWLLW